MNENEAKSAIASAVRRIAPEANLDNVPPDVEFREELDIDSMDFLNLLVEVETRTGVAIPEDAYDEVSTIEKFVTYLVRHSGSAS